LVRAISKYVGGGRVSQILLAKFLVLRITPLCASPLHFLVMERQFEIIQCLI